ncbi:MAG: class I SAM-dependent methyltransferase [Bacteroidetes bacterium]|nr:class I SAM-dependent methyltransferase [Bacteroidota bacterium]
MNEFDLKAKDWDMNPVHIERSKAIAEQMIRLLPLTNKMRALEFGAGTGVLSFILKDRFAEITLMDSSREMLKKAEEKIEVTDRLKFRTLLLNLENEEYSGDPFDIIYSQMVLHHIKDTTAIFSKFYDLLKPGGILAIADLYLEDGSFHDGDISVHFGFDPDKLAETIHQQGFYSTTITPCFMMRKVISAEKEKVKEYPVFLLTAVKP